MRGCLKLVAHPNFRITELHARGDGPSTPCYYPPNTALVSGTTADVRSWFKATSTVYAMPFSVMIHKCSSATSQSQTHLPTGNVYVDRILSFLPAAAEQNVKAYISSAPCVSIHLQPHQVPHSAGSFLLSDLQMR